MKDRSTGSPESWYLLNERAKELNCLYQVDEYLRDERLSLNEMFEKIVQVIPSGWQYPDVCHARIVYDNCSYQTEGFCSSSLFESAPITLNDKVVGQVEVVYIGEIPQTTEDYFLENESKLIRTIADRISQTLLHRQLKYLISMWNVPDQQKMHNTEWRVIVDLLYRTDPDMLLHICTKMINFLYWTGIKEAEAALEEISPGWKEKVGLAEANYPTAKPPIPDIGKICEKTFAIAQNNLSDTEISLKLRKWIQEQKAHYLVKTVDRIGASLGEIIDAILRYQNMAGSSSVLDYSTERWLLVALTRRFLSDNLDFIEVARRYLTIDHFCQIVDNLIYPTTSMGKIGGKSTGLYMAHKILEKESIEQPILQSIKIPKTWYITTDTHTEFLHYNNLEDLKEHKYKDLSEVRMNYPGIIRMVKNGKLPPDIVKSLAMCLDDFGNSPIIVRSSSLLEDQMGAAFSGKYKSLFLANQGTKQQRLEALQDAILEVYASLYSPDSIKYRSERGLLDFHEEMGIMIQEVVGTRIGPYFLPVFAGVGFSNNEFRWSPRIKREDGLVRMVMGLGTRAVDRLSDDFPVLIAPG
ncbi:MAG: hypothetical protein GX550_02040 [Syntrophomonadaceae bacterium]|nr:hypothetical protein [Syntrophomonadaceae bacterium]